MTTETVAAQAPGVLEPEPVPKPEQRSFHGTKILGWTGKVSIDRITGWVQNRRVELFLKEFQQEFAREPTGEEIYEHMLGDEREYRLRELARNIASNGLRVPVILGSDGTLLDGNRRYFACRFAIENRLQQTEDLRSIPAWVLTEEATQEEIRLVLVETNFLGSFKVDWKEYIKAHVMWEDRDAGLTFKEISERYGVKPTRVRSMVMAMDLISEFVLFFSDDGGSDLADEAEKVGYESFTHFEEAHNKLRGRLDSDADFKEQFFRWMLDERFESITQIRKLGDVWADHEAREKILEGTQEAVKDAISIAEYNKIPGSGGGERKLRRAIATLRGLKEEEIASISSEMLEDLKRVLAEVYVMAKAVIERKAAEEGELTE